jgi:hypothetical protein
VVKAPVVALSAVAVGGVATTGIRGQPVTGVLDQGYGCKEEDDNEEEQHATSLAVAAARSPGVRLLAALASCSGYEQCTQIMHHLLECLGKPGRQAWMDAILASWLAGCLELLNNSKS